MTAAQAQITGTWSQSGPGNEWQAQAGSVYVRVISTSNVSDISAQTMGCAGAYSDAAVGSNPSFRFQANSGTTIEFGYFDAQLSTTRVYVETPVLHVDRVGGDNSGISTSALFTLASGSWTELSQNDVHFESSSNTFYRTIGATVAVNEECGGPTTGTAAGSLRFNQPNTGFVLSNANSDIDAIEVVMSGMFIFDPCTDGSTAGTPTANDPDADGFNNVCDIDDDNDGILDSVEGCNSVFTSTGAVNGDPTAQTYTTSPAGNTFVLSTTNTSTIDNTSNGSPSSAVIYPDAFSLLEGIANDFEPSFNTANFTIDDPGNFGDFSGGNAEFLTIDVLGNSNNTYDDPDTGVFYTTNVAAPDYGAGFAQQAEFFFESTFVVDDISLYNSINYEHREYIDGAEVEILVNGNSVIDLATPGASTHVNYFTDPTAPITITNIDKSFFQTGTNTLTVRVQEGNGSSDIGLIGFAGYGRFIGIADADGDGIANCLDLDSDNDGCSDAEEGAGSFIDADGGIQNDTLTGGVNTDGIPIAATSSGQAVGDSQDDTVEACDCPYAVGIDSDGDGVDNTCDLDDDNDGILDKNEGACTTMLFSFDSDNEGWNLDNDNNGALDGPVGHSSTATTTGGCTTPGMAGATGNYLVHDDQFGGAMYFESPNNMNLCLQNSVGGALTFLWRNETFDGLGAEGTAKPIVLHGAGISISTTFNNAGLGWQSVSIPLDDATWSGSLADLEAVLEDLDRIEIRIEDITGRDFDNPSTTCTNAEWFALDEVQIICTPLNSDSDGIADYLDLDSDNDGCADYIEGGGSFNINDGVTASGTANSGTGSDVTTNLGNTIGTTSGVDRGVPTVAGTGQAIGDAQDGGTQDPDCSIAMIDTDGDGISDLNDLDDDNDGILDVDELSCSSGLLLDYSSEPTGTELNGETLNAEVGGLTIDHSITGPFNLWEGPENAGDLYNIFRTSNDAVNPAVMTYDFSDPVHSLRYSIRDSDAGGGGGNGMEAFKVEAYYSGNIVSVTNLTIGTNVQVSSFGANYYEGTTNSPATTSYDNGVIYDYAGVLVDSLIVSVIETDGTANQGTLHTFEQGCVVVDTDNDGIPNYLDLDSDNDGCPDYVESGGSFTEIKDGMPAPVDLEDGNGDIVTTNLGTTVGTTSGVDQGVPTVAGTGHTIGGSQDGTDDSACLDSDADGIPDSDDLDDDNDGILDVEEALGFNPAISGDCDFPSANFDASAVTQTAGTAGAPFVGDEWTFSNVLMTTLLVMEIQQLGKRNIMYLRTNQRRWHSILNS